MDWQELADTIAELQEEGRLEIFVGDYSVGFEVGLDEKGVYLTVCPDCIADAVGVALGAGDATAPPHKELH